MKILSACGLVFALVFALGGVADAAVVDSQAGGFTVNQTLQIKAPPAAVWRVLIDPKLWWSSEHTYSGDARNLLLEPRPGGPWSETLPGGGGVRHMVVAYIDPPRRLRLEGGLGPLQAFGAAGHLTFALKAVGEGTEIALTYDVGGHAPGGLDKLAIPVDTVLGQQLARLKTVAETRVAP